MAPKQPGTSSTKQSAIVPPSAQKAVENMAAARRVATPANASAPSSSNAQNTTELPRCAKFEDRMNKMKCEAFEAATCLPPEISGHIASFFCRNCNQNKPEDEKVVPLYGVLEQAVPLRGNGASFQRGASMGALAWAHGVLTPAPWALGPLSPVGFHGRSRGSVIVPHGPTNV